MEPTRRHLHGRRQGRPLRDGLKRLFETELAERALTLPEAGRPLDPASLFAAPRADLWLEIGFGGGEHLSWQAAANPEVGFLAAEIFLNGVAKALRSLREAAADNVRLYTGDGRDLLDRLPPGCLGRAFVLFPDPWPKARHNKRRIVQGETLDRLAAALRPGAELRLATDDPDYAAWMLVQLDRHPDFAWTARRAADWRRRPADWPPTRYEEKALAAGRAPAFLIWRRR